MGWTLRDDAGSSRHSRPCATSAGILPRQWFQRPRRDARACNRQNPFRPDPERPHRHCRSAQAPPQPLYRRRPDPRNRSALISFIVYYRTLRVKDVAQLALDVAAQRGATYADARIVDERNRSLTTKNGKVGGAYDSESLGIGIRVIANGAWGFAAVDDLSRTAVEAAAAKAVAIAKASATVKSQELCIAQERPAVADWASPCEIDPFTTSMAENIEMLLAIDRELKSVEGVTLAEANLNFRRYDQWFCSSEGAEIHQLRHTTGAGYAAYSFEGTEIQKRSFPNSFGGQYQNRGYELIGELKLLENARRIAEEAVALHKAARPPHGKMTVVLDSSQLGLQIHESVGHPIELDRVLGMEANFAGTSFLTVDKLRNLRYGSPIVNVVADATPDHGPGLGTFAYDDEGVAAQRTPIITNG